MPQNPIRLIVTNTVTYIDGKLSSEIYQAFKKELGYYPEDAIFRMKNVNQKGGYQWDGFISTVCYSKTYCHCPIKKDGTHFPSGLLTPAKNFFDKCDISYSLVDNRDKVEKTLNLKIKDNVIEERPYQNEIVEKSIKQQRGIIKCATGGGKSACAAKIIAKLGIAPFIFYVPSKDLLKQAKDEFEKLIIDENNNPIEIGIIGDGKKIIKDINVMTIQTAVRALGEKYKKFDDEDEEESDLIKDYSDIKKLIVSAKGIILDEVQHAACESVQVISDYSENCKYKYGCSGTPHRDLNDDILIDACFGREIVDISASYLIQNNYLMKPDIYIVPIKHDSMKAFSYPEVYKKGIVENTMRNLCIANISKEMKNNGRVVLILCKQISHGNILKEMIEDSVFIHGLHSSIERKKHLDMMRQRIPSITIASSLPYSELLLIKNNDYIRTIEIGDLCHNYKKEVDDKKIETLCSFDGKTCSWSKVTDLHIHKKENNLVWVKTDKNEDIIVTENHSLIDENLNRTLPLLGNKSCVPFGISNVKNTSNKIKYINLLHLFKELNDDTIEVEVTGINQPETRRLNKMYQYIMDKKSVSKDTRLKYNKVEKLKNEEFRKAIIEVVENFKYYKYRRRATLNKVANLSYFYKYFNARIFIRRSRKKVSLPILFPITESFALISGLMCGDGHIKKENCLRCRSFYCLIFSALEGNKIDGVNDIDKRNIRNIFIDNFKSCFDVKLNITKKQIIFNSKLLYYLFKCLGHIDLNGEKRVPDYIFNSSRNIQEKFLWGLYLTDGSKKLDYRKGHKNCNSYTAVCIHSSSRPLVSGLCYLLKIMNMRYYITTQDAIEDKNTKYRYVIAIVDNFDKMIMDRKVDKRNFLLPERTQKRVETMNDKFQKDNPLVYDITVENCHNFISGAGGVLAHNTILDEGIDVKPLDTLILAGSGKSSTRALQRVGRTLRKYEGKKDAIVIDFEDHCKYLLNHSKKRIKMYKSEPLFNVQYWKNENE